MRDGVDHVLDLELLLAEQRLVVDVLFRLLHDLGHGLHGLDRVLARGGLAGEHDCARAVIDSVGHVGDLRTGRARVVDHGFEHFRGRDDPLAEQAALGDEVFLDGRKLRKRHLHAQVSAADHDAGTDLADLLHIVDARLVLNLGDDLDVLPAVRVEEVPHIQHILPPRDERRCDEIDPVPDAEQQIVLVLFAEIDLLEHLVREGHALAVRQLAADYDTTVDLRALNALDREDHESVVDQYRIADRKIVRQPRIADADDRLVALDLPGREGKASPAWSRIFLFLKVQMRNSGPLVSSMMAMGRPSALRTLWIMSNFC